MMRALMFRVAAAVLPMLPGRLCYAGAWVAAEAAYRLARQKRAAVTSNMRRVLGLDPMAQRLQHTVRGIFHTQARNYVDLFRIPRIPPNRLANRVEIINLPTFLHAHQQGKGVIIATAHLGNFDLLVQVARHHGIGVTVLVERLQPERLFQSAVRLRSAHGIRLLPVGPGSLREIVRTLRAGGVVAMATDRDLQGRGLLLPFFGEGTTMPAGAIELGIRTGALVLPCFGLRLGGGRYRINIEPPLNLPDLRHGMARLIEVMEGYIREHPEQWVVFEPIWERGGNEAGWPSSDERISTPIPV